MHPVRVVFLGLLTLAAGHAFISTSQGDPPPAYPSARPASGQKNSAPVVDSPLPTVAPSSPAKHFQPRWLEYIRESASLEETLVVALHVFVESGRADSVKAILDAHPSLVSARVQFGDSNYILMRLHAADHDTPIQRAARYGHAEVVRYLLQKKADPNAKDGEGWTPLHVAVRCGDTETVKVLLAHGADPSMKTDFIPPQPVPNGAIGEKPRFTAAQPAMSAVDIARKYGCEELVKLLAETRR